MTTTRSQQRRPRRPRVCLHLHLHHLLDVKGTVLSMDPRHTIVSLISCSRQVVSNRLRKRTARLSPSCPSTETDLQLIRRTLSVFSGINNSHLTKPTRSNRYSTSKRWSSLHILCNRLWAKNGGWCFTSVSNDNFLPYHMTIGYQLTAWIIIYSLFPALLSQPCVGMASRERS